jgi:glycosyltransferase involved in cell wall biosynthesis
VKIWYSFPHPIGAPGIATVAWHQVRALCDRGVEVVLFVPAVARRLPGQVEVRRTVSRAQRWVLSGGMASERAWAWHDRRVAAALDAAPEPPDLVHTWPAACLRTLRVCKRRGIVGVREAPSAHTADGFAQSTREQQQTGVYLPRRHPFRADAARLAREEEEFGTADALLVPSESAAATYRARGLDPGAVLVHRYGFDPQRFRPDPHWVPPRPGELRALYVGRIDPAKGVHYALEAWVRSGLGRTGGRFTLVGDMLPKMASAFRDWLGSPGVTVHPFTHHVGAYMRAADVLVLATVTEGSALVTYEAQGCGCVLLVSEVAGADCRPGVDALVHPVRDVGVLADQLTQLGADPNRLVQMRRRVLERTSQLTWSAAGEALLGAYAQMLRPRGVPLPAGEG